MTSNTSQGPRLPPLTMLRAFEAAGRTGSMRAAAEDIGVSHTVVSRHVRNLEHWFNQKLVRTGPRGVELTPEGETLLAAVSKGFDIISRASQDLRPRRAHGRLRLWCFSGLATRWLTPRLSELEQALDGAEIELRATEARPEFSRKEADAFIGFNVLPELPHGAVSLTTPRMFPVANPAWLERHGWPRNVEQLARMPLIHEGNHLQWNTWFDTIGYRPGALSGPRLSDASISFDAALAGQGIALVNGLMAADELRSGRLIEPFATDVTLGTYYLLIAPARHADPTMGAFRDWLVQSIQASTASYERAGSGQQVDQDAGGDQQKE